MLPSSHQKFLSKYTLPDTHYGPEEVPLTHPKASPESLMKIWDQTTDDILDWPIRDKLAEHQNAPVELLHKAMEPSTPMSTKARAVENKNADYHVLSMAMDNPNYFMRYYAVKHENATPDIIQKALTDEHHHVRYAALINPKITNEQLRQGLNDNDVLNRSISRDELDRRGLE